MHFKPSIIAVFAALLTVTTTAPTPASEIKEKRAAAPGDPAKDYIYEFKDYSEEEKRSDPAKDYIYYHKSYPEEEKRNVAQALGVVHLNRVAPACKPRAEETKATIHTVFKERPDLANPSRKDHSDPGPATGKPTWGGLWVQRNETYKQGWGISMFHALHCLEMIRDGLADKSSLRTHGMLGKSAGNAEPDHHKGDHVRHCFAYIAQVITCTGDGTIEPPWEETDPSGHIINYGVDGEGYQHECRDTRRLWEASLQSEEHAVKPWDWHMGDSVESVELLFQG
ncbi:MAG: hypothetical protein ALECFALPRED_001130 [Alectoria fallacina]|uniref:Uncharacterized protein n=1 Tax=Alectoria fallacina TaxID=1903189 RepID=A0A8H3IHW7_9LECA|nr:MAG: hypothetical protein ALECFALPRED_001130 [Alectoria fallacina]